MSVSLIIRGQKGTHIQLLFTTCAFAKRQWVVFVCSPLRISLRLLTKLDSIIKTCAKQAARRTKTAIDQVYIICNAY